MMRGLHPERQATPRRAVPTSALARLIDHAIDAALVVDAHGQILYANPAMQILSGWSIEQLVGAPMTLFLPDDQAGRHEGWMRDYAARGDGVSTVLGRSREMSIKTRAGILVPVELKAVDLGRVGRSRLFGGFMQDLRPRRALQAEKQALIDHLQALALTDPLTNLPNRRAFEEAVLRATAQMRRTGHKVVVAQFDFDHFKAVNDRFGHVAGDAVLRTIAQIAAGCLRAGDFIGRVGGEEFALLLPEIDLDRAMPILERLRQAVAASELAQHDGRRIKVTISIGATELSPEGSFEASWERADTALFAAKQAGRNRTMAL